MALSVKTVLGRDKHMGRLMKEFGAAPIGERPLFDALVRAIISQMMSVHHHHFVAIQSIQGIGRHAPNH